jgi:hypothetical protein
MHQIETQQLDQASLDYLTRIDESWGAQGTGVFIRRSGRRTDPRLLHRLALYLGLLALGLALVSHALRYFRSRNPLGDRYFQAAALALGGGLLVRGGLALRRPLFRSPLGDFYWADALHFWDVTPEHVCYLPLDLVREAQAAVGGYTEQILGIPVTNTPIHDTFMAITLDVKAGSPVYFTVYDLQAAERLVLYINAVVGLRQLETVPDAIKEAPDQLGRAAIRLLTGGSIDPPPEATDIPQPLPTPHQIEPVTQTARPALWERFTPWLVAVLFGVLGMLVL